LEAPVEFSIIYEAQVAYPTRENEHEVIRDGVELAELADEMGFDRFWAVEHHSQEWYAHMSAPEVFLSFVAARTSRIRLGHGRGASTRCSASSRWARSRTPWSGRPSPTSAAG
jgi:Luciferase-like monooxygenase